MISIGTRVGPYEIVAAVGAGAMGEVYRARDTQLNRDVAIKVLPELFALDAERLARFTREAQTLAALNHPNIAHIHGLEGDGSPAKPRALVMELVEGDDLSVLIARGPIPVADALPIARQIADALEAAHEAGIIHRDLKPANIKVRRDGTVKVLDFGLAKAVAPEGAGASADAMRSPTLTALATQMGTIIGTAAYMAPEQARGKAVDKRADIWAFGVVLFEMLAGRQLFSGDTVSDTLASVLREDLPWAALPADTPRTIVGLLRRCLARDPRHRLRDIGEARLALADTNAFDQAGPTEPASLSLRPARHWRWGVLAVACLLGGLLVGALLGPRVTSSRTATADRPARTLILHAAGRGLDDSQAISPDGRWIAYTAGGSLWIRDLSELEPREVKASQGARRPFWSPSSDAVAYAAGGRLWKVSTTGGTPLELCNIAGGEFTGGSWSASQGIVFTSARANWDGQVMRVPQDGGTPEVFAKADATRNERRLFDPHFMPDGRSLLYSVVTVSSNEGEIVVDRDGVRTLLGTGNDTVEAVWSPTGHVVFTQSTGVDTALWALPFSLQTMARAGESFRIAAGGAGAAAAIAGTLVYSLRRPHPHALARVDRSGQVLGVIAEGRLVLSEPKFSPDGRMLAATVDFRRISIWDTDRGVETRVTGDDEDSFHAAWLPGSRLEIAFTRLGNTPGIWARRPDGTGSARQLFEGGASNVNASADGKQLAFYLVAPDTRRDLWAKPLDPPGDAVPLLRTNANEARPQISPDGKFVAYQSDVSGRWEVYVMPFPRGEGRLQISTAGGEMAAWNPRGGELFFVSGDDLMAVSVTLDPVLKAGRPQQLFGGKTVGMQLVRPRYLEAFYTVAPDGRSFVVVKGQGMGTSDVVVADGLIADR